MEAYLPLLILFAPLGMFTLVVPAIFGYFHLSLWWIVIHALVASLFSGTGGLTAKLATLTNSNGRRTSLSHAVFWLIFFPWVFALLLTAAFYGAGYGLSYLVG